MICQDIACHVEGCMAWQRRCQGRELGVDEGGAASVQSCITTQQAAWPEHTCRERSITPAAIIPTGMMK